MDKPNPEEPHAVQTPQESSPGFETRIDPEISGALERITSSAMIVGELHTPDSIARHNDAVEIAREELRLAHQKEIQTAKREAKESGYHDGCIATDRFMEHHYRIEENKVWIEEYRGCIKLCLPNDTKTISWYEGRIYDHEKRIKRLQELEEETTA